MHTSAGGCPSLIWRLWKTLSIFNEPQIQPESAEPGTDSEGKQGGLAQASMWRIRDPPKGVSNVLGGGGVT